MGDCLIMWWPVKGLTKTMHASHTIVAYLRAICNAPFSPHMVTVRWLGLLHSLDLGSVLLLALLSSITSVCAGSYQDGPDDVLQLASWIMIVPD